MCFIQSTASWFDITCSEIEKALEKYASSFRKIFHNLQFYSLIFPRKLNRKNMQAIHQRVTEANLPYAITCQNEKLYIIVNHLLGHIRFRTEVYLQALVTKCPRYSKLSIDSWDIPCK